MASPWPLACLPPPLERCRCTFYIAHLHLIPRSTSMRTHTHMHPRSLVMLHPHMGIVVLMSSV